MNSQEGPRFCTTCGRERTADDRFCAGCGKPINSTAAALQPAVAPQPQFQPTPAPPGRSRWTIVAMITASVLVLLLASGGTFAYSQGLFASPKQFLLQHLGDANTNAKAVSFKDRGVSAKLQLKLTGLSGEAKVLEKIENQPIDLSVTVQPAQRLVSLSVKSALDGEPLSAALYASADRVILETGGVVPFVATLTGEDLSDVPAYVYATDKDMNGQLKAMWDAMDEALNKQATTTSSPAQQDLARFILEAVPDRFFERTKWNEIRFSFDHQGAGEITRAVIGRFFDEPERAADLLADVISAVPEIGKTREEIRSEILKEVLAPGQRSEAMDAINEVFADSLLRIERHTFTLGWSLRGSATFALEGGITMRDDVAGATLSYAYSTASAGPGAVQLPSLTKENSMSFVKFIEMKMQQSMPPMDYSGPSSYYTPQYNPNPLTPPSGTSGSWSSSPTTNIWSNSQPSYGSDRDKESYNGTTPSHEHGSASTYTPTQPSSPSNVYSTPSYPAPTGPVTQPCSPSIYNPC